LKVSAPTVLMWGRMDPNFARNRIIASLFTELGWHIDYFHPVSSQLGMLQSLFSRPPRPTLIWIPAFRQRDVHSAFFWGRHWGVPIIFDPITSNFEKDTFERHKWSPGSRRAERRKLWEKSLFLKADLVVLENDAYADFVHDQMQIPRERLAVIYQGAFTDFFKPTPPPLPQPPYEIIFVGSFHPSMGTDIIVDAARLTQDLPCRWILIGDGDLRPGVQERAQGLQNVIFEGWIEYAALPQRLSHAHIVFVVFGTTFKTDFVIPNKVFESMAVGRPLITQSAASYMTNIGTSDVIGWVPRGDARALAETVRRWLAEPEKLAQRGTATRSLFDRQFGPAVQQQALHAIIDRVL